MLIEKVVKDYLDDNLSVDAFLEIPKGNIPDSFVVFRVTDRGKVNQINAVTMEFQSYGPSKYEAALLDAEVRLKMEEIVELPDISCKFGGGNDDNDTTLKKYRYRCYFNLFY